MFKYIFIIPAVSIILLVACVVTYNFWPPQVDVLYKNGKFIIKSNWRVNSIYYFLLWEEGSSEYIYFLKNIQKKNFVLDLNSPPEDSMLLLPTNFKYVNLTHGKNYFVSIYVQYDKFISACIASKTYSFPFLGKDIVLNEVDKYPKEPHWPREQ